MIYNKEKKQTEYISHSAKPADAVAWKVGKLIFKSRDLNEVIADIQRKYNVKIRVEEAYLHCVVTADFNNEPLARVLKVLAKLLNITIKHENGEYKLTGNGC
ncbi:ferric-dicitrate binding protein FerR (iron transport regulator) [Pedobacter sp. CG_S7]|uniref:DUF4974 domain-containing protein n=1 Tax=Pedobacter sp. CG_S7 TaxID=3143930 RepID=UPI003392DAAF